MPAWRAWPTPATPATTRADTPAAWWSGRTAPPASCPCATLRRSPRCPGRRTRSGASAAAQVKLGIFYLFIIQSVPNMFSNSCLQATSLSSGSSSESSPSASCSALSSSSPYHNVAVVYCCFKLFYFFFFSCKNCLCYCNW